MGLRCFDRISISKFIPLYTELFISLFRNNFEYQCFSKLVMSKRTKKPAKKKTSVKKTVTRSYANYSSKIQNMIKEQDIELGDRVKLHLNNNEIEGNLLAQNELGDPNTILIKLDNGYNIGLTHSSDMSIEKLEGSVKLEEFQVSIPKQKKNLPQISLLATGGTIASRIDYQTGGVVMAMQPEEIFSSLPELFDEVSFKSVKSLFNLGSEDMNHIEWKKIATEVKKELETGSQGIVISHGTDTMGYTAAALSFMLQNLNSPVVITGAQRSSDRGSFDGAINLISASRIAANANIASVMVCMHESTNDDTCLAIRGTKVRKMHTSRRDAFRPINDFPLARIDFDGNITEVATNLPRRHSGEIELKEKFEEKVTLIKTYPGIDPAILEWYIDQGTKGVIIEGTGLGHAPSFPSNAKRSWIPSIARAVEEGIIVGMTSQCIYGRVHPFVYKALRSTYKAGAIYLEDTMPETAFIKLGWALGNYTQEGAKEIMKKNIVGEISEESRFKEFLV